jgi:hypothetical protein
MKKNSKTRKMDFIKKYAPFVWEFQPLIFDLHMARRGEEVPY